ncbi:MAG: CBS domain-containing protein [Candidatus Kapaibacterium sp.]
MPATKIRVDEIMARNIFAVQIDDTVHEADEIMKRERVRHVPVLEGKKYVGLITERTLIEYSLRHLYDYEDNMGEFARNKINDFEKVMLRDIRMIFPEDSVRKAITIMLKEKVDCLPVVDWDQNLMGLVTSIDILLFFNKKILDGD